MNSPPPKLEVILTKFFAERTILLVPITSREYVIKFVSDLRQVGGFLRVLRFPPPIKLTATI
jgi:hypothetical protein